MTMNDTIDIDDLWEYFIRQQDAIGYSVCGKHSFEDIDKGLQPDKLLYAVSCNNHGLRVHDYVNDTVRDVNEEEAKREMEMILEEYPVVVGLGWECDIIKSQNTSHSLTK